MEQIYSYGNIHLELSLIEAIYEPHISYNDREVVFSFNLLYNGNERTIRNGMCEIEITMKELIYGFWIFKRKKLYTAYNYDDKDYKETKEYNFRITEYEMFVDAWKEFKNQ